MPDSENTTMPLNEIDNKLDPSKGRRIFIGFGINDYDREHFKPLNNAVRDVEAVAELLEKEYGFEVFCYTSVEDTSRQGITTKLLDLIPDDEVQSQDKKDRITERDSLILYFSGHGLIQGKLKRHYFVPSNGQNIKNDDSSLISGNHLINVILPEIPCFHLLLIIDCCFAGGFAKEEKEDLDDPPDPTDDDISSKSYLERFSRKSRYILTSGWLEPVSDGHKGTHSPFAQALLDRLLKNEHNVISYISLVEQIDAIVSGKGGTVISDRFNTKNHDRGQFVFYKINDGRPNRERLKQALLELNYKPQINEIRKPSLFNLYYLNGTELCGHHLFTHRFFMERKKKVNIFHAIPHKLRFGIQEGARSFDDLWQVLARHFGITLDGENIEDKVFTELNKKLKSENCIIILKVEEKCDNNKLETILSEFWIKLNEILVNNKDIDSSHGNNFYLFILDRRGKDRYFDNAKIKDMIREPSDLAKLTWFSPILPVDKINDLEDWWDIHRNSIEEAKFQGILFDKFENQEYIADAIEKLCDQCDRPECFAEFFLNQWSIT